MNITDEPNITFPGTAIVTAFCNGPNGRATRLNFWKSREDMEADEPAMFAIDFACTHEVIGFFQVNLDMVTTVYQGLMRRDASRN